METSFANVLGTSDAPRTSHRAGSQGRTAAFRPTPAQVHGTPMTYGKFQGRVVVARLGRLWKTRCLPSLASKPALQ